MVPAVVVYIERASPQSRSVSRPFNLVSAALTLPLAIFPVLTLSLKHLLLYPLSTSPPTRHLRLLHLLALVPPVSSAQLLSSLSQQPPV
jgi:hypothetical protein